MNGYVVAGYVVPFAVLSTYAYSVLRKARRLRRSSVEARMSVENK